MINFYSEEELERAKETLHSAASKLLLEKFPRYLKRAESDNKVKLIVDDVMKITNILDEQKCLGHLLKFVAADLKGIPTTKIENVDLMIMTMKMEAMRSRFDKLEKNECRRRMGDSTIMKGLLESKHADNTALPVNEMTKAAEAIQAAAEKMSFASIMQSTEVKEGHEWFRVGSKGKHYFNDKVIRSTENIKVSNIDRSTKSWHERNGKRITGTKNQRIFGMASTFDSGMKPGVEIVQKVVVHLDNLSNDITEDMIQKHLESLGVSMISCFPSK